MNKIKIENVGERVDITLSFDNLQVAQEFFFSEECIADIQEALTVDSEEEEEDPEAELKDNDLLRASVATQIAETKTETIKKIIDIIENELIRRKSCYTK